MQMTGIITPNVQSNLRWNCRRQNPFPDSVVFSSSRSSVCITFLLTSLFDARGHVLFPKFKERLGVKDAVFVINQNMLDGFVDAVAFGDEQFQI